jgi:UDP-N-acetylglucosamine--N-acetylmuramyl-(pentapeptide) pyrophosphoryl-undecaprenol N-acetylglucosamine transferase
VASTSEGPAVQPAQESSRPVAEPGLDLLVASGGGHLHELELLRPHLRPVLERTHWVTYGTEDARVRLAGEEVTTCHFPTSRNLPNAARNLVLARRVLRELRPARVVSTGAAVAVPFLWAARSMGVPGYYLESAARVDGPSMTGKLVRRLGGTGLFTQYEHWSDHDWSFEGSVFDGFETEATVPDGDRPLRIAISVGTHFPMDRLIAAVDRVTSEDDEVFAQIGRSGTAPSHWETAPIVAPDELEKRLRWADVVVCHAGVGLLLTAFTSGRSPLVVPRRLELGEAVDDHQAQLARVLSARGLARTIDPTQLTRAELVAQSTVGIRAALGPPSTWSLPTRPA